MRMPIFLRGLMLVIAVGLASCGGGGSGSSVTAAPATVGVLLTDAPVAGWDEAIATITSVELIGGDGPVVIFSGSQTLDLLELGDFSELFAVSDAVPPGSYSKIRLRLSDLVLRDLDDEGDLIDEERPQLVGNGKIDLNPRGPFRLESGDVVFVELDFDMEKSLKITTTGGGKLIVRPVVFVDIRTQRLDGRLSRVYGEVRAIDAAAGALKLCQSGFASQWDDDDSRERPVFGAEHCLTVRTDDATGIFDPEGLPQDLAGLEVGEKATVIGRINRLKEDDDARKSDSDDSDSDDDGDDDADDESDHYLEMTAAVIEEGPLGTYSRTRGTAASGVDASSDRFDFEVEPGQGLASDTTLPVQLFEKSRIFNRAGAELDRDAIIAGRGALVDGVLVIGDEDLIRSPLVVLDGPALADAVLEGQVVSVNLAEQELIVNDGTLDRCVSAADADIFLVNDDDGLSSSRGDLDDLSPGDRVVVFGEEGSGGCFEARTILAED